MDNAGIQAMMPEENVYQVAQPIVKTSNGRLLYVRLDIDKPMNTYLDLRQWFNATQGDQDNVLPIMIFQNGMPMNLNGYTVQIQGMYPDGETPFVISASGTGSGSGMYNFHFPAGVFQVMGRYTFQFKFSNGTSTLTSKVCFFDVEPDMLTMAYNFNDGVNPYDNQYQQWKSMVEQQVNALQGTVNSIQDAAKSGLAALQGYQSTASGLVDKALSDVPKLDGNNTFNGSNTFTGSADINALTVEGPFNANNGLTVNKGLTVKDWANLPANTTFNAPVLKYENGNLSAGLFPCEGYWFATSSAQSIGCSFVNGVTGYMSFKKFHYTPRDGDSEWGLMEIHMNAEIPTSAFGKPVVQFSNLALDGMDQTPFIMGGHVFIFDVGSSTLKCNGYATGYNSTTTMDARMI